MDSKKSDFSMIENFQYGKSRISKTAIKYHYTSPSALLSIIQSGKIRFTDARFLNDRSEIVYFIKTLLDFLEINENKYPLTTICIKDLLSNHNLNDIQELNINDIKFNYSFAKVSSKGVKPKRHFVFCSCGDYDNLNMWNYYVNNGNYQGYNIGFNIKNLLNVFSSVDICNWNDCKAYYGKVLYKITDQNKAIEFFLKIIEKLLFESIESVKSIVNETLRSNFLNFGKLILHNFIGRTAPFFKSKKFATENEFRVVLEISEDCVPKNRQEATSFFGSENENMYEEFCVKNGLIVPFIQVEIPKNAIKQVTVSPIMEFEIAEKGIRELLLCNGIKDVEILHSEIPIRF